MVLRYKDKKLAGLSFFLAFFLAPLMLLCSCSAYAKSERADALKVAQWKTKNGVNVLYINTPGLPMLDIRLLFHAGSARDGKAHGLAALTNATLVAGTEDQTSAQVKEHLDRLGSQLGVLVGRQMAEIDLRCLTYPGYLKPSIKILRDLLGSPVFRESDITLEKSKIIAVTESYKSSPSDIAFNAFLNTLYHDQPYAHRSFGSKASVEEITRGQMADFYKKYYVTGNTELLMVGDLTLKGAKEQANLVTSHILQGPAAKALPLATALESNKQVNLNFPSSQTHIILGKQALTYHDSNFYPLLVANYILGGSGLSSKLFKEVRDKKGLVYSINSYFIPTSYRGMFVINLQTRAKMADKALQLTRGVLDQFIKVGPSKKEVAWAVKALRGQQIVSLTNHDALMNALGTIATYHLPPDYYTARLAQLSAVTPAAVKKALQDVLKPSDWVQVMVGPLQHPLPVVDDIKPQGKTGSDEQQSRSADSPVTTVKAQGSAVSKRPQQKEK